MSEWHSEHERWPWGEDKNFPISIHQERWGRFSIKEEEREQDAPISRDRIERDKKVCFSNGLFLIWNPCGQLGSPQCQQFLWMIWPERAPSRRSGIGGVKGHNNMSDNPFKCPIPKPKLPSCQEKNGQFMLFINLYWQFITDLYILCTSSNSHLFKRLRCDLGSIFPLQEGFQG